MLNEEPVKDTNAESIWQIINDSYSTLGFQYHRWCHKEVEKTLVDSTEGVATQQHWKLKIVYYGGSLPPRQFMPMDMQSLGNPKKCIGILTLQN